MNISKQAVLEIIESIEMDLSNRCYHSIVKQINALPSISDGWISVGIKEPETGSKILIWHLVFEEACIIEYATKDAYKYFKFWQPLPPEPTK